jgi:hypothetical protein
MPPYNDEFHNVIKKMIMMFFIYIVRFIIMKGTRYADKRPLCRCKVPPDVF